MIITHKISMDFVQPAVRSLIRAVQGDSYTRAVEVSLYENGAQWIPPTGASVLVRYRLPDGTGDAYSTLPDGSNAWSVSGNTLTVTLAPQMLVQPGMVEAQIQTTSGTEMIATFSFNVVVERDPSAGVPKPAESVIWANWTQEQLDQMLESAKENGEFDGASIYAANVDINGYSPYSIAIEDIVIPSGRVLSVGDLIISADGYLLTVSLVDELYITARCTILSKLTPVGIINIEISEV